MGLFRNQDVIRVCDDDPQPQFLLDKIAGGANVTVSKKNHNQYGSQVIISCPGDITGANGGVLEISSDNTIPNNVNLVLLNSGTECITATLPHPSEMTGWLSIVAVDTTNGVKIAAMPDTIIFDDSNIDFNFAGDSMILASNRVDTWYVIARHFANWYY